VRDTKDNRNNSTFYYSLDAIVHRPLILAGHGNELEINALVSAIKRDLSDRPGDLALLQMALYETWRESNAGQGNLVEAYVRVGGFGGALAHAAEEVRTKKLTSTEGASLESILVRLINLGETAGATRRTASITEFTKEKRPLAENLSTEKYGRLLIATETSVELCHEQLISQWPWWQNCLTAAASDVRRLGRLSLKAQEWASHGRRMRHLSTGAELRLFKSLRSARRPWLSSAEVSYIKASTRRVILGRTGTAFLGFVASLPLTIFGLVVFGVILSLKTNHQESQQADVKKRTSSWLFRGPG
jgi:hypothetical protein